MKDRMLALLSLKVESRFDGRRFAGMAAVCLCFVTRGGDARSGQQAHLHYVRCSGRWNRRPSGHKPRAINTAGATTGYFVDASSAFHGFVRAAHGAQQVSHLGF